MRKWQGGVTAVYHMISNDLSALVLASLLGLSALLIQPSAVAFTGLLHYQDSNCSLALNASYLRSSSHGPSKVMVPRNLSIRALNIGSGTTATRLIHRIFCPDLHLKSMHWKSVCSGNSLPEVSARNELVDWSWKITLCIYSYELEHSCPHLNSSTGPARGFCDRVSSMSRLPTPRQCLSNHFLQQLQHHVIKVFTEIEAYSDTPVDYLFGYLAKNLPSTTKIIQTVRDPTQWAMRRFLDHPYISKICRSRWSNSSQVNHPFDIVNCMRQTKYLGEALEIILPLGNTSIHSESLQRVRDAYTQMTSFNAWLAKDPLILCLWDGYTENKSMNALRVRQEILEYFSKKIRS